MTFHCACNIAERECVYPNCHTGKKSENPPVQDDPWKKAVLLQCMLIECCYRENDPVATLNCLIDWHVKHALELAAIAQEDERAT